MGRFYTSTTLMYSRGLFYTCIIGVKTSIHNVYYMGGFYTTWQLQGLTHVNLSHIYGMLSIRHSFTLVVMITYEVV